MSPSRCTIFLYFYAIILTIVLLLVAVVPAFQDFALHIIRRHFPHQQSQYLISTLQQSALQYKMLETLLAAGFFDHLASNDNKPLTLKEIALDLDLDLDTLHICVTNLVAMNLIDVFGQRKVEAPKATTAQPNNRYHHRQPSSSSSSSSIVFADQQIALSKISLNFLVSPEYAAASFAMSSNSGGSGNKRSVSNSNFRRYSSSSSSSSPVDEQRTLLNTQLGEVMLTASGARDGENKFAFLEQMSLFQHSKVRHFEENLRDKLFLSSSSSSSSSSSAVSSHQQNNKAKDETNKNDNSWKQHYAKNSFFAASAAAHDAIRKLNNKRILVTDTMKTSRQPIAKSSMRILDFACGSGAFGGNVLESLVYAGTSHRSEIVFFDRREIIVGDNNNKKDDDDEVKTTSNSIEEENRNNGNNIPKDNIGKYFSAPVVKSMLKRAKFVSDDERSNNDDKNDILSSVDNVQRNGELPSNSFDLLLVSDFFYQYDHDKALKILKKLLQLTKPGGAICIIENLLPHDKLPNVAEKSDYNYFLNLVATTVSDSSSRNNDDSNKQKPNEEKAEEDQKDEKNKAGSNKRHHHQFYTINGFKQLLLKSGWVKIDTFSFAPKTHSVLIARKSII